MVLFYRRKRKSGNYEVEKVDSGNISEKDRMLKEKEAEVLSPKIIIEKSNWHLSVFTRFTFTWFLFKSRSALIRFRLNTPTFRSHWNADKNGVFRKLCYIFVYKKTGTSRNAKRLFKLLKSHQCGRRLRVWSSYRASLEGDCSFARKWLPLTRDILILFQLRRMQEMLAKMQKEMEKQKTGV